MQREVKMQFAPWRRVADWHCRMCGECCKLYSVVLNLHEWLRIVKTYGAEKTATGIDKLYINKRMDGSCAFLCNFSNSYMCGLQQMKPKACQLWPFKVLEKPTYGFANEAAYEYGGNKLFVYIDTMCNGVRHGMPSWAFANHTIREFVEIAAGLQNVQHRSTVNTVFPSLFQQYWHRNFSYQF